MHKILLIGASGFVGSRLLSELKSTYSLQNYDKRNSILHPEITTIGNVLDIENLQKSMEGSDCVVLLAAEHQDNVSPIQLYYDVNVQGMKNVLKAMNANGIKNIIFTSSVAVYGMDKKIPPDESTKPDPFNHYGISKWQAEEALHQWAKEKNDRNALIIRPTVIFGEGNRGNVYNLLKQICSGMFVMIGKGENKKSMCYIENIVAFLKYKIGKGFNGLEIFNFKDSPDLTMNELVRLANQVRNKRTSKIRIPYFMGMLVGYSFDLLAFVFRKKIAISSVRVKKFCATTSFNSDKLKSSGFVAPYTIKEGLKRTIESIV